MLFAIEAHRGPFYQFVEPQDSDTWYLIPGYPSGLKSLLLRLCLHYFSSNDSEEHDLPHSKFGSKSAAVDLWFQKHGTRVKGMKPVPIFSGIVGFMIMGRWRLLASFSSFLRRGLWWFSCSASAHGPMVSLNAKSK